MKENLTIVNSEMLESIRQNKKIKKQNEENSLSKSIIVGELLNNNFNMKVEKIEVDNSNTEVVTKSK